jgi:hypothetical protein
MPPTGPKCECGHYDGQHIERVEGRPEQVRPCLSWRQEMEGEFVLCGCRGFVPEVRTEGQLSLPEPPESLGAL